MKTGEDKLQRWRTQMEGLARGRKKAFLLGDWGEGNRRSQRLPGCVGGGTRKLRQFSFYRFNFLIKIGRDIVC